MNQTDPRDPLDELRRANPFGDDQLPPTSRARVWARIEEARMDDTGQTRIARWVIAGSGVTLVAVMVAALTLGGTAAPPPVASDPGSGGGGAAGMCIQYSIELLKEREFAFDGTVTALDGNMATFSVTTAFWGVETGSSVTLQADLMANPGPNVALEGGPILVVGQRYLVSGDDTFAWTCGYTQEWTAEAAAEWAAAN